jgi:hypothetical protein
LRGVFPEHNTAVAYIYLSTEEKNQSVYNIVGWFLQQWWGGRKTLHPALLALWHKFSSQPEPPPIKALIECLQTSATFFKSAFLIVDGLDELESADRHALLTTVLKPFKDSPVRIIATSRPHIRKVRKFFADFPQVPIIANVNDLRTFLEREIEDNASIYSPEERQNIVRKLVLQSDGLYPFQKVL